MENTEIIYGKNPVDALLESNKRRINKIFIAKGIKYDEKIKRILSRAKEYKISIHEIPREKLDNLTKGVHQGIAASVAPIEFADFNELLKSLKNRTNALLIILDKVEDPHNFGSIIRTAASAGADGIIIAKRHSSPVTSTVEKASAGTIELTPIVQASNIANAIEKLKENNFWVIGAESSGEKYYFEQDYDMNCAIILGGEDQGISPLVAKNCDILVKIPMSNNVNSLNVSNAASILIYEIVRQRILKNKT
ncbi:MAG TPA: 23S rRNA (guanosine(2251)-2'-O)-methyltransferase RlmB [Candidatus Gastranaerophilales bacterium]|nr:23S rRNA (guanosine(2251)-2'-O)-methyltransferase RlmB [Candidatus Gastranaerophilales bacterium]